MLKPMNVAERRKLNKRKTELSQAAERLKPGKLLKPIGIYPRLMVQYLGGCLRHSSMPSNFVKKAWHELRYALQKAIFFVIWPRVMVIRIPEQRRQELQKLGYRSQFAQDYIINKYIFRSAKHGIFVDIGANHPEYINNTYYYEKTLHWSGIACDPISLFKKEWQQSRPQTTYLQVAVGESNAFVDFYEVESTEGWEHALSYTKNKLKMKHSYLKYSSRVVNCMTLNKILEKAAIKKIDLLCIDVESAEQEVLNGFGIESYVPSCILIENSKYGIGRNDIRKRLSRHGYLFYCRIWTADDIFIRFSRTTSIPGLAE
jgi:FkbM family methyltransferase